MRADGVPLDLVTYNTALLACERGGGRAMLPRRDEREAPGVQQAHIAAHAAQLGPEVAAGDRARYLALRGGSPRGVGAERVATRLYALGHLLGVALLAPLGYLLHEQLSLVASNVTMREEMSWFKAHPGHMPPSRGDVEWPLYAPHDRGSWVRNVGTFVCGSRCTAGPNAHSHGN